MKNQIQKTDFILPGGLGTLTFGNGQTGEIKSIFKKNDGSVTITVGPAHTPPQRTLKPHE